MLEPDRNPPNALPSQTGADGEPDKRRPYVNFQKGPPPRNLNGQHRFERTDDTPQGEQQIMCGHLALLYCERTLKNPRFHPETFFTSDDPRKEDPLRLTFILDRLTRYSRVWHLLPSQRFGDFLRLAFEGMLQRGTQGWVTYMVQTFQHSMALRLRVKKKNDGSQELVAQVYDPNITNHHTTARQAAAQDWGQEGLRHDLLSFLPAAGGNTESREYLRNCYCGPNDPDAHIAVYELQADAEGNLVFRDEPCPLGTNWACDTRVQLHLVRRSGDTSLLDAAILNFFCDPKTPVRRQPGLLLEWPDWERSVLFYILLSEHEMAQQEWEACWRPVQDSRLKVQLLRGHDSSGQHLLLSAHALKRTTLSWWFGLVATLPADQMLEVLKFDDKRGYAGMYQWISVYVNTMPNPWPPILNEVRAHRPDEVRKIMASATPDGEHALARCLEDRYLPALREWGTLLKQVSDDDRLYLLQGCEAEGVSALYTAMRAHASGWVTLWGEWCADLPPDDLARLLLASSPQGKPGLWALATDHDPATMQAWIGVWRQLPPDQRSRPLAACLANHPYTPGSQVEYPGLPVLHRAMTGADTYPGDARPGSEGFIRQWGACLAEVPPGERFSLLRGSLPRGTSALWRGLASGHWRALVAWSECLQWVTPSEKALLTQLPNRHDHPVAIVARARAKEDPTGWTEAWLALQPYWPPKTWQELSAMVGPE